MNKRSKLLDRHHKVPEMWTYTYRAICLHTIPNEQQSKYLSRPKRFYYTNPILGCHHQVPEMPAWMFPEEKRHQPSLLAPPWHPSQVPIKRRPITIPATNNMPRSSDSHFISRLAPFNWWHFDDFKSPWMCCKNFANQGARWTILIIRNTNARNQRCWHRTATNHLKRRIYYAFASKADIK